MPTEIDCFPSRAAAAAASIATDLATISVRGYTAEGDAPTHRYARLPGAPGPLQPWQFESADGAYWQLDESKVNVKFLGAKGDGATDDGPAIQNAVNFGRIVYVPPVPGSSFVVHQAQIILAVAAQVIEGDGNFSKIVFTLSSGAGNGFTATNLNGVALRKLNITPSPIQSGTVTQNNAIYLSGCDGFEISECEVSGHYRGICLDSCTGGRVVNNYIHDGANYNTNSTNPSNYNTGADIYLHVGCLGVLVEANVCERGAGEGICVQVTSDTTGTPTMTGIVIVGNTVRYQMVYGIIVYNGLSDRSDTFRGVDITGNTVEYILGNTPNPGDSGNYDYGAGIYVQQVENCTVTGNIVRYTNLNTQTQALAPAGIGCASIRSITISANIVESCNYYGIMATDANQNGTPFGVVNIVGNTVSTCGLTGLYLLAIPRATITGNVSRGNSGHGCYITEAGGTSTLWSSGSTYAAGAHVVASGLYFTCTIAGPGASSIAPTAANSGTPGSDGYTWTLVNLTSESYAIASNFFNDNVGLGLSAITGGVTAIGNHCYRNQTHGMQLSGAFTHVVTENRLFGNAVRGLECDSSCAEVLLSRNIFNSNPYPILANCPIRGRLENSYTSPALNAADAITGTYGGASGFEMPMSGATPIVTGGEFFAKSDAVALTNLTGEYVGQRVTIRAAAAAFVVTNNSTIITKGGANLNVPVGAQVTLLFNGAWREL